MRNVFKIPWIVLAVLPIALFVQCSTDLKFDNDPDTKGRMLPRALFITTGSGQNNVELEQGVVVAVQSFNKRGVPVRLETRDVLYHPEKLREYNILILSTFPGYHDADRKYSLTYMDDVQLENLNRFVQQGGVLIAGDNLGRNFYDGTDRIVKFGKLAPENWVLSATFGVRLSEKNMSG